MLNIDAVNFRTDVYRYIKYVLVYLNPVRINITDNKSAVLIDGADYQNIINAMEKAGHVMKHMHLDDAHSRHYSANFIRVEFPDDNLLEIEDSHSQLPEESEEHKTTWSDVIGFYMSLPYKIEIGKNPDGIAFASNPELEGCSSYIADEDDADEMLYYERRKWIIAALRDGKRIPLPELEGKLPDEMEGLE